jgi:protein-S-isoprenylcysteine O-methyltransferase Ste14
MSTASETAAPNYYQDLGLLRSWVARRRIAISIACFTALIVFNLAILRRHPSNPLAVWQWNSGIGLSLILLGLAIRTWSAGTLIKVQELITSGPYALSRNPLYVGSFLMMYGFSLIMYDWLSIAFIAGPMSILYYFQVLNEEKFLAALHPEQWANYAKQTSRFVPLKFNSNWRSGWSVAQWMRNREYQAILGVVVGVVGLIVLSGFAR